MKILLAAQWYEPIIGGEEIHVRTLAKALSARGHQVTVAALAHQERPERYVEEGVEVRRLRGSLQGVPRLYADAARQSVPPFPDPGLAWALRGLIDEVRPDVIHAHNWIVYSLLPIKPSTTPLVLTLHDYSLTCATKVRLYRGRACDGPAPAKCMRCAAAHYGLPKGMATVAGLWASKPAIRRRVDSIVCVSDSVARDSDVARFARRHTVIPNFLDDDYGMLKPSDEPEGLPDGPFIMYAGSLSRIKGLEPLIRAYRTLDANTRPPLVVVGYRGHERLQVLDRLPADVHLVTDLPRRSVAAAWRRALFAVVPSICLEAFGLVALEAMTFGRPVVASDIGGLPELIAHEQSGLLVEPGSVSALRAAMQRLIDDAKLRAALGSEAEIVARRYRAGTVVPAIESLYESLLG